MLEVVISGQFLAYKRQIKSPLKANRAQILLLSYNLLFAEKFHCTVLYLSNGLSSNDDSQFLGLSWNHDRLKVLNLDTYGFKYLVVVNLAYVYMNYPMSNKILATPWSNMMTSQIKLSLLFTTHAPIMPILSLL